MADVTRKCFDFFQKMIYSFLRKQETQKSNLAYTGNVGGRDWLASVTPTLTVSLYKNQKREGYLTPLVKTSLQIVTTVLANSGTVQLVVPSCSHGYGHRLGSVQVAF